MSGFLDFIREQGVIGLAVGFILGAQVGNVVKAIVEDVVNPVLGLALNSATGLKDASFSIASAKVMYGALIMELINFIVIALVVYFGIKALKLDRLDKKKEAPAA